MQFTEKPCTIQPSRYTFWLNLLGSSMKLEVTKLDIQKLEDYFKFDEADLQANRSGYLSEKQKNHILEDQKRFEKGTLGFLGIGVKTDITGHTVRKAEGPVNIVRQEFNSAHGHFHTGVYLHIDGKQFNVDEDLANVLTQGYVYTVYYEYMGSMKKGVKRSIIGERDAYEIYYDDSEGIILSVEFVSKAG